MFSRLCFWKPHNRDFAVMPSASEDLDGLALQDVAYDEIHQWERESLNNVSYLHRKSSLSASTSFNQPSALVLATWNEIECTHSTSTSEESLGSLVTAASETLQKTASLAPSESKTQSSRNSIMSVSFDEKYAQLLMYSQDENNSVSELDASAVTRSEDDDESISLERQDEEDSDDDSYKDEESNDGYNADNDECSSVDFVPTYEPGSSLGVSFPHPAQFQTEVESLAWRSDATEMTRIIQRYDAAMCCGGNTNSESSESSVWSSLR